MSTSKMGARRQGQHGAKGVGPDDGVERLDEFDLAADLKGRNSLHGDDQGNIHNQRQEQAGATGETEGLIESFENADKQVRARREAEKRRRPTQDSSK